MYQATAIRETNVISVFEEPDFVTITVRDVKIKLPTDGDMSSMHDTTNDFLRDLLTIDGVADIFMKYGATIEKNR